MVQHLERIRPPGRNDPCPCGSGKKYKKCCLLHVVAAAAPRSAHDILAESDAAIEDGDSERALCVLETAQAEGRDPSVARRLVERLLALPPEIAETRLREWWDRDHDRFGGAGLARLLAESDRKDEALRVLDASQGTDAWPEYWCLLARLREERGDIAAAVAAMELYARQCSDTAEVWMELAGLQERAGQTERALQALRRAGDLLPADLLPRLARLRILAGQERWREVRDLAEALLEGSYDDSTPELMAELRDLLARSYFVLGYFDAARRLWESLLAEDPDDGKVRLQLATLELASERYHRVPALLDAVLLIGPERQALDLQLRALLQLREFDGAATAAAELDRLDPPGAVATIVTAAQAVAAGEHAWAAEQLNSLPPEPYTDLWAGLLLPCLAHLGRWSDIPAVLRAAVRVDDQTVTRVALAALAAGKFDLAERLLDRVADQQVLTVRSLSALVPPLRQSRRATEERHRQQVDQAEVQRRALETRELRRRVRDLEQHNAALTEALAISESAFERLLERVGVLADDSGANWEAHVQGMVERAHKDALAQELAQAEQRLLGALGSEIWGRLSESTRASLREGEWLYTAVQGEDRDCGAALLEYARGLERAFKDAIFVPARARWQRHPGPADRLQDEGHDPSLGPFVRFVLGGGHLTLGSMAAALDRMADIRRRGVAVTMLRQQLGIDPGDDRTLNDWRRTAERLGQAAEARNHPAHAATVSRVAVGNFRELVLGTDGLLRSLTPL